jgi:HPt (histidine-containing phosphotransfer) domain-containing protein
VHTLKGASAAIGARLLQQLASSCELAIAQGEGIEKLRLLAFDIEYELVHFAGALHDRLPALATVAGEDRRATGMGAEQLEAAMQTLRNLLASGDYGAQRFHREIAADLRDAFGEAAGTLAAAVRNHDHERALVLLETMKAGPRTASVQKDL